MATEEKSRKNSVPIHYLLEQGYVKLEDFYSRYKKDGAIACAEHYNISTGTLYGVLKEFKLNENRTVVRKVNDILKTVVVGELRTNRAREVAKKHGLSYQTVCKLARTHGIKLHRAVPWDFSEATEMISELQRQTPEAVATHHGFPVDKVVKLAKFIGIELPRVKKN